MNNLNGKGKEMREHVTRIIKDSNEINTFKSQYGESIWDIIFDNFIRPMMDALLHEDNKQKAQQYVSKLDLFCAAFVNNP
jgi:hypothetical protein